MELFCVLVSVLALFLLCAALTLKARVPRHGPPYSPFRHCGGVHAGRYGRGTVPGSLGSLSALSGRRYLGFLAP